MFYLPLYRTAISVASKIRASTYLIGAMLARFGRTALFGFGGCNFSDRPIDMHLYAAVRLGAKLNDGVLEGKNLRGADIYFDKQSVGATVNALIMASRAYGKTRIYNPAIEPHVRCLVSFLRRAGVKIEIHHGSFTVFGTEPQSTEICVIPDMIEAGTFASLALMTQSEIRIRGVDFTHLDSFFSPLIDSGAILIRENDSFTVKGNIDLPIDISTAPFPGFPTDLQPIVAPLMHKFCGGSITDSVWPMRFGYLEELSRFGGSYTLSKNKATLYASTLHPASVEANDLRGGASLLIAALSIDGISVIEKSENIDRGYENIVGRLQALGADLSSVPF